MFVRTLFIGLASAALLPSISVAQIVNARRMDADPVSRQIISVIGGRSADFVSSQTPTLNELARQATDRNDSRFQSCEAHRLQNQQWVRTTQNATTRKTAARAAIPAKQWTSEELAASKFQVAHGLWKAGNTDAARRWLQVVLSEYSHTQTADRARIALAKL